ncbi:MAG TPA: sugar transferase [Patescibacteria group bacterium]|nr:sugar transferase [Patescibacteria group bacterium]
MYKYTLKRIIDVILASMLIIFFLPICLIVAIIIKIDSKGPIFADVPERVGGDGKLFRMYKFRSMIANAHFILRNSTQFKDLYQEYKRSSFKLKKDPRITRIGKFIRRHSLDEIPQLINVLKGDMSIVGPRAYYPDELVDQQKKYPHTKILVKKVLSVKPGITGLWQTSGRSEINFDKRIAIDAQYVKYMSFVHDIFIIAKTPWAMVSGRGAV